MSTVSLLQGNSLFCARLYGRILHAAAAPRLVQGLFFVGFGVWGSLNLVYGFGFGRAWVSIGSGGAMGGELKFSPDLVSEVCLQGQCHGFESVVAPKPEYELLALSCCLLEVLET